MVATSASMSAPHADAVAPPPSFNRCGPFYRLQHRLGLVGDTQLRCARRALLYAALAWLPLLLLAALQGVAWNEDRASALLFDFRVHAFAIAIAAFVLMEESADRRLRWLLQQFVARGIAPAQAQPAFVQVYQASLRRTGSPWGEALLLLLSYAMGAYWIVNSIQATAGGWAGRVVDGSMHFTWAGWWALLVTLPLYGFLCARWLWRFGCWALMLRGLARCPLRLVATHADRCGGLSFVGLYPSTYTLFVFAFSTVVSAGVLRQVVYGSAGLASFKFEAIGLVLFLLVAFVLPLTAFTPRLLALKRAGLSHYGALVSRHNLAFEQRWIESADGAAQAEALGSPDVSSLADLSAGYELVERMKPLPLAKAGVAPLLLAALLPIVVVAATQAPFKQILGALKGMMLL